MNTSTIFSLTFISRTLLALPVALTLSACNPGDPADGPQTTTHDTTGSTGESPMGTTTTASPMGTSSTTDGPSTGTGATDGPSETSTGATDGPSETSTSATDGPSETGTGATDGPSETGTSTSDGSSTGGTTGDAGECPIDVEMFQAQSMFCFDKFVCEVVFLTMDCCGSQAAVGVHKDDVAALMAENEKCFGPEPTCDCAPKPITTQDGGQTEQPDAIGVTCNMSSYRCETYLN